MHWFYWLIDLLEPTPPAFDRLHYYEPPSARHRVLALVAVIVFISAIVSVLLHIEPTGQIYRPLLANIRK